MAWGSSSLVLTYLLTYFLHVCPFALDRLPILAILYDLEEEEDAGEAFATILAPPRDSL